MGILSGNPKNEPMHYGEIFSVWQCSMVAKAAADTSLGLVAASQVIGQSIREDIGALFAKYHVTKTVLGVRILQMNKEKGWLIPPPLQIKRPDSDKA
ncbi:DUF3231 family protein [Paenibacillus sp. ACRRY]|uniref:DUF3231 family protein n=1 Tax=Paenibacillus sp. ACRRY TaxID=2918208 RepID=UPI001EF6004A|nr:DUF3231 family protein [Paenibacillus sp. ACRRY]MCG7382049.1 DUF3231 family protein [Paenibacillus sp. ACRRY]